MMAVCPALDKGPGIYDAWRAGGLLRFEGGVSSDMKILLQAPQVGISTYNGSLALEFPSRDIIPSAVPEEMS